MASGPCFSPGYVARLKAVNDSVKRKICSSPAPPPLCRPSTLLQCSVLLQGMLPLPAASSHMPHSPPPLGNSYTSITMANLLWLSLIQTSPLLSLLQHLFIVLYDCFRLSSTIKPQPPWEYIMLTVNNIMAVGATSIHQALALQTRCFPKQFVLNPATEEVLTSMPA